MSGTGLIRIGPTHRFGLSAVADLKSPWLTKLYATCGPSPCSGGMLLPLPKDHALRRDAYTWLAAERIRHLRLFQSVRIDDARDAERFKAWLIARAGDESSHEPE